MRGRLEIELLRVQLVMKEVSQEYVYHCLDVDYIRLGPADDCHIIDESDISSAASGRKLQNKVVQI